MDQPTSAHPDISIVVPLLNEAGNIAALEGALRTVLQPMQETWELILVDDGSRDGTWEEIQRVSSQSGNVRGLSFTRNFGHQKALVAGMDRARGWAIVTMDGDLQHPPEVIPAMIAAWKEGYRVVNTRRIDAEGTGLFKRLSSRLFYRIFSALSGIALSAGTSDFRLIDRSVLGALAGMRESHSFIRGLTEWTGFSSTTIEYRAAERHSGTSKYSLGRMVRFAANAVLSFSVIPLKIGIWIGLITSGLAFLELVYIFLRYLAGETLPGWASLAGIISFMFGVLFILVGIVGAYLGSIFEILKNRPPYIVEKTVGFDER
ncbi:MAG: glycosyltransferase family 2 protein [candidate division Zixibacteria bacterium]|jgi:dolichol-phosphate mannosyltransferase|nr:glycosyltransferase family 2 protein [candidate division Zixibacteria bacterium]